jgi:WD40 repeat protein
VIYGAEQRLLGREAVVKVLHVRDREAPERVDRFLREAKLASRLDHPYAAHIYAFGAEPDGLLWIAMERVRGTSLAQVLASQPERRMPLGRFVHLLELICEVVHAAHEQGIVHRDLKPANIMVLSRAGRLLPKLLDFGVAKQIGEPGPPRGAAPPPAEATELALTQPGAHLGSPFYMAPEQWAEDGGVDARSDVYALGVLTFEALTGRVPFAGGTVGEIARQHTSAEVPALPADLPAALAPVLRGALAKSRDDRPASALAFAEAVRVAAGVAVSVDTLPRLEAAVRQDVAWLPQPIADAIAGFETARNPHQARDALWEIVHVAVRYVGLVALAARSREGPRGAGDAPVVAALLRELRHRDLADEEWLALAGALVRPYAAAREAYPVPELVDLVAGPGPDEDSSGTLFAPLLAARTEASAATTEAALRDHLVACAPALARLLRGLLFLTDYQLVVPRAAGGEIWMGPRRSRRPLIAVAPDLAHGRPILVDFDGHPVLQLAPLVQIAAPTPGAAEELFLFAGGRGDRGRARLVAEPHGFERLDEAVWDWFRAHVLAVDDEAAPAPVEQAPYRGLSAFTASDAGRFFGREHAADAFANQLLVQPLVAVVGPSGAGKSSFVQAGVLPRLPAGWRAVVLRPGTAPLAVLAARTELPAASAGGAPAAIAALLRARAGEATLVIVVDQFEEVFTLCKDPAERTRFAEVLAQAARSVDDRIRVILTVRDDFLVRAGELAPLRDRLAQGLTLLATPAPEDLVRVVALPARQVGYRFDDPELPLAMVRAVAGQPGALALLSFTAARLWELRDRHFHQLTRKAYDAIGGVEGALAGHAEATLLACATDQQRLVREVFRHLVTAEGTRAVLGRDALIAVLGGDNGAAVLERLIAARLLVAAESDTGEERIEIVHEALLTSWPRLVEWRREDVESARLRDQLRTAALQWHERGRPRGLLWRGEALDDYRRWRKRWPGAIPATDLAFATASLADEARGRRIRRALAASAVSLLVTGTAALAVLYRSSRENAVAAHDRLIQSYEEQGRRLLLDGEYLRALPYLAEAYAQGDASIAVRVLLARAERLASAELAIHQHAGHVSVAAFRPGGAHILSVSDNGEAAVWEAATGRTVASLPGRPGGPYYGKVSRDGAFVASPSREGVVLWDGIHTRTIPAGNADRIAIDPGGQRIAVASGGELSAWSAAGGARLWTASTALATAFAWWSGDAVVAHGVDQVVRIADGRGVVRLPASGPVDLLAVGAEGTIATTSGSVIELWDVAGTRRARIDGRATVTAVAISKDGRWVAVAGDDQILRLYEGTSGAPLGELVGHRGAVGSLEFSADGTRLASAGSDLTVRIWEVATRRHTTSLLGARDQYVRNGSQFDPTGARLVVPTWDGAIRVFATAPTDLVTSIDAKEAITLGEFFDGGQRFATSSDHEFATWATTTGHKLAAITTPPTACSRISPDGKLIALLPSGTAVAEIREVATGALAAELHGSGHFLWASFDHANRRIVTGSDDHLVELWTVRGERLATLRGHTGSVVSVAFSRDDKLIASGSTDRTARVWEIATGREIRKVTGGDVMASVEFDATGTRLLTGNADRLVRLWNIATGDPLRTFEHTTTLRYVTGSPDGTLVAGATTDGAVSIWDSATSSLLVQLHHQASAESVDFWPGGPILLSASADHQAVLWHLEAETRSHETVTAFARCHAPYVLRETRLEPVTPSCHDE